MTTSHRFSRLWGASALAFSMLVAFAFPAHAAFSDVPDATWMTMRGVSTALE